MASPLSYLARAAQAAAGRRQPFVLCYHGVSAQRPASDPRGLFVTTEQFEEHLDLIQGRGYELVGVTELWRQMQSGADVSNCAAITFDDGLAEAAREAMPILERRGAACTMFIATGLLGRPHPHMSGQPIMTADEVVALARSGMEVGAHTVDHVRLPELSYAEALGQMRRSRCELEDLLEAPVTAMAYPFGAFDEPATRAASEAGYEIACGCTGPAPWRAMSIPREPVFPTITRLRLRLKMAGLFGPVHASRGLRAALRPSRDGPAPS